jgi:hypothetical protein
MSNLSALLCFLGFFWMLWDRRKQTWHDMVANSLVVRAASTLPASSAALPGEQPGRDLPSASRRKADNDPWSCRGVDRSFPWSFSLPVGQERTQWTGPLT